MARIAVQAFTPTALLERRCPRTGRRWLLASLPVSKRMSPSFVTKHKMAPSSLRAGFLNLNTTEIWAGSFCYRRGLLGLHPLDTSAAYSRHPPLCCDNPKCPRHCQMSRGAQGSQARPSGKPCSRAQGRNPGAQWRRAPRGRQPGLVLALPLTSFNNHLLECSVCRPNPRS